MASVPGITLTAVVSKRKLTLDRLAVPTLFVLVGQETAGAAWDILSQVRAVQDDPSVLQLATVVDLRAVPRLLRKVGEKALEGRYQERSKALDAGQDPRDRVIIVPDFDGKALEAFGLADVSKQPGIALVAPAGSLVGVYQGDEPAAAALDLVSRALA